MLERAESGPHQALVCGNVLIVTTFFYFHSGETLTKAQGAGCFLIIVGAVIMSDILHWADNAHSILGFSWLLISMALYGASMISWRLVSMEKQEIPWQPQLLIVYGVMGAIGFMSFSLFASADAIAEFLKVPLLLLWPLLNVIASFLGMWAVNLALHKSDAATGALTAIVDSNAIVLVVLNRVVLNMVPSITKCAGMVAVLVGYACVTLF
jgi:drug/metabolite transporter (DMT)-like permease